MVRYRIHLIAEGTPVEITTPEFRGNVLRKFAQYMLDLKQSFFGSIIIEDVNEIK